MGRLSSTWNDAHLGGWARLGKATMRCLPSSPPLAYRRIMHAARRRFGTAPSAEDIETIARQTLDTLPPLFADRLGDVVLLIEEFADAETLGALGIEDPFELSGVYEGLPLPDKGAAESGGLPDRIRLFRRPILDEWSTHDYSLEQLVRHIVIHEAGHHFGFSDDDMHALEGMAGDEPDA